MKRGRVEILVWLILCIKIWSLITIFLTILQHTKNSDEIDVGVLLLYAKSFEKYLGFQLQKFFKIYFCEKVF